MKDKSSNKENRITVRLTPNQSQMLDVMSSRFEVKKSALVRYIIDQFIAQYDEADGQ